MRVHRLVEKFLKKIEKNSKKVLTDSTPVSYTHLDVYKRQGEKDPGRGVKENLKPCVYKLSKHESATAYFL